MDAAHHTENKPLHKNIKIKLLNPTLLYPHNRLNAIHIPSTGIEPVTYGLEIHRSIRLSYEGVMFALRYSG